MSCLNCRKTINATDKSYYGLHKNCFIEWFKSPPTEFVSLQRRSTATSSDQIDTQTPQNSSFFHGKFKKYSANLNGNSYILKMRQEDAPELPEVEYLCNQIGRTLGIPVAEFFYIEFNGEKTFVTKNFIKPGTPTDLQHLYHFRPDDEHSCEGIINAISQQTKRPNDVSIFIKTLLFDSLIGNHDRHGRNLGFIITAKGSSLSPIYDNVSYLSLEKGDMLKADFNPTGKICTKSTYEPTIRDYVKELKRLSFTNEVLEFYQNINLLEVILLIDKSFCSSEMKDAIKRLIKKRFEKFKNELT